MPGPQERRLITALAGAHSGTVETASDEWKRCATTLQDVARALRTCKLDVPEGEAGSQTAHAMSTAFATSAGALDDRAQALVDGSQALANAAQQIRAARAAFQDLGDEPPAPGAFTPPDDDAGSEESIKAKKDHDAQVSAYNAKMAHREEVAKQHADALDTTFRSSSQTMKKIHGEPDPQPQPAPASGGSGGAGGRAPAVPAGHAPAAPSHDGPKHPTKGPTDLGPGETGPGNGDWPPGGTGGNDPGTGGPGPTDPPYDPAPDWLDDPDGSGTSGVPGTTTPGGGGGLSTVGGAVGAGAGVAGGGLAAAALSGGLRNVLGPQVLPASTVSGTPAAAAARPIGAGTQAASGVLGRTGASTSAGASGVAGRGGSAARAGGTAGRSSTGSSTGSRTGSRTAAKAGAGSRGAAGRGGASAAGRGRGSKDDERGKAHELFDVDEDWTGDEDGAPSVLQ